MILSQIATIFSQIFLRAFLIASHTFLAVSPIPSRAKVRLVIGLLVSSPSKLTCIPSLSRPKRFLTWRRHSVATAAATSGAGAATASSVPVGVGSATPGVSESPSTGSTTGSPVTTSTGASPADAAAIFSASCRSSSALSASSIPTKSSSIAN